MDLQEKRQLDPARQVAKVKDQARLWRAIIALVLAVAAAVVSFTAGDITSEQPLERVIAIAAALVFGLLAVIAVVGFASKSRDVMQPVTGRADAAVVRYTIVLVGSIAVLFITLGAAQCPDRPAPGRRRGDLDHPRHRRPAVARQRVLRPGPAAVPLYRFRTRCRVRELRFGRIGGLGQDRGSCLSACCT